MAHKVKLTRGSVEALRAKHQPGCKARHWDSGLPGLFLRITAAGAAAYCVSFKLPDGTRSEAVVGSADVLTPEEARSVARGHLARMDSGGLDPAAVKRRDRADARAKKLQTLKALSEAFMAAPENAALAPRTREGRQQCFDLHILPRLGSEPVNTLTRAQMRECVREIQRQAAKAAQARQDGGTPGARMANTCHALLKRLFNWAMEEDRVASNPATFRRLFDETPEKRTAMPYAALREAWLALNTEIERSKTGRGAGSALALQLCAVTLQRLPKGLARDVQRA
jgi:Arm DNA-binding domain